MTERLKLGISTCPNDTYAFHGLMTGAVRAEGLELDFELADVEALNEGLIAGRFDATKASFHAALFAADDYVVLPVGAALGFGVGPVLLAGAGPRPPQPDGEPPRVLCPGEWTTAHLLYRLLHPGEGPIEQVVFSEIMPALESGHADLGVCIHEGRFTWRERGLQLVEDLGASWEARTGAPLPLGGILARRALGTERIAALTQAIGASIDHARAHPTEALVTMRRYAQEQRDEVLWAHVELYVNEWTRELGARGRAALAALADEARAAGLVEGRGALEVFEANAPRRLFHFVPAADWRAHLASELSEWRPASLEREGFVHLSFAEQLQGSADLHYAGEDELAVLELDPTRVTAELRLEPSRGGALFPHLYRPLLREDIAATCYLRRGARGFDLEAIAR